MGFPSTAKPKVKIQSHQAAVWGASLKVPAPNTQRIIPAWIPTHELTLFLTDPTICTQGIINSGVVLTLFRPHIQDGRSFVLDSPGACLRPCPAADICAARQERRQEFKDVVTVAWHRRTSAIYKFQIPRQPTSANLFGFTRLDSPKYPHSSSEGCSTQRPAPSSTSLHHPGQEVDPPRHPPSKTQPWCCRRFLVVVNHFLEADRKGYIQTILDGVQWCLMMIQFMYVV